jgi:hypothetical protein
MNEKAMQVSTSGTHKVGTIETEGKVFTMSETCWSTIKYEIGYIKNSLNEVQKEGFEVSWKVFLQPEAYFLSGIICYIDNVASNSIVWLISGHILVIFGVASLLIKQQLKTDLNSKLTEALSKIDSLNFQVGQVQQSRNE